MPESIDCELEITIFRERFTTNYNNINIIISEPDCVSFTTTSAQTLKIIKHKTRSNDKSIFGGLIKNRKQYCLRPSLVVPNENTSKIVR